MANTQSLSREVGLRTVVSTGAGLALASISYVSLIELSDHSFGHSGWIALGVAGLVCLLSSFCFAELGGMFPSAAGIKLFIEKAFGEKTALLFATLYILTTLSIVGAETFILGNVLAYGFPGVPVLAWTLATVLGVAVINIRGIRFSGAFQDWVTYLMFAGLILVSIMAFARAPALPPASDFLSPLAKGPGEFFQAVGLGVFLFLGFEWVTPLAEEVREYRAIPRGMAWSIVLLFATYALLGSAMTAVGGKEELSAAVAGGKPIPHVLFAVKALGPVGLPFMMAMSLLASVTSFNAGLLTASRFLYAMARDHAAPRVLARVHEQYLTPVAAIWVLFAACAGLSVFVSLTGVVKPFIYMGAFVECLIYVVMAASLLRLRRADPTRERPYRVVSPAIPWFVLVFFTAIGIGLLAESREAMLAMAGGFAVTAAYVFLGVPYFKGQAAARAAASTPRRRRPAGAGTV